MDDGDDFSRKFLIQVLEFLAADSNAQVESFPDSNAIPELLTLLWHDSFEENRDAFENGLVSRSELGRLKDLEGVFGKICAPGRPEVWRNEALAEGKDWDEVRGIARDLLRSLNPPPAPRTETP